MSVILSGKDADEGEAELKDFLGGVTPYFFYGREMYFIIYLESPMWITRVYLITF